MTWEVRVLRRRVGGCCWTNEKGTEGCGLGVLRRGVKAVARMVSAARRAGFATLMGGNVAAEGRGMHVGSGERNEYAELLVAD